MATAPRKKHGDLAIEVPPAHADDAAKPRRGRPPKEDGNEGDTNDRIRMTVDFPPTTSKRLKDLKDILEAPSHIDVLRRALAFYEEAVKAKKDGGRIYIEKANGEKLEMSQLAAA
jgi:hypothetical protein